MRERLRPGRYAVIARAVDAAGNRAPRQGALPRPATLTMRRLVGVVPAAALLWPSSAAAHASLERSDPVAGAQLGAAPSMVRFWFSERPDPALSRIEVIDAAGRARQSGGAAPVAGDPNTPAVPVAPPLRGGYTVRYRAIGADDGHASAGTLTFGVDAVASVGVRAPARPSSLLEVAARTAFIAGLVLVLGAVAASLALAPPVVTGAAGPRGLVAAGRTRPTRLPTPAADAFRSSCRGRTPAARGSRSS